MMNKIEKMELELDLVKRLSDKANSWEFKHQEGAELIQRLLYAVGTDLKMQIEWAKGE